MQKRDMHFTYYFLFSIIVSLFLVLLVVLSPNRSLQMLTVIAAAFLYTLWGIVHHMINHDLVAKIVVEYVLVASLGIAIAFFLFRGGFGL